MSIDLVEFPSLLRKSVAIQIISTMKTRLTQTNLSLLYKGNNIFNKR